MTQEYKIIKQAKPQFPVKELIEFKENLIVGYPAFGPNNYQGNLESISKDYSHPETQERISFRPAVTSESISGITYGFGKNGEFDAKRDILDPRWLQLNYIVRTQEGVFLNTQNVDEDYLKKLLNNIEKVNGIYLIDNNIAFAPYDTFERGVQDCDTFAQGGLARALEHTPENVAKNLREIASTKHYKNGVEVWGFDDVKEPVLKVVSLCSYRDVDRLVVDGDYWVDGNYGSAFGVLEKSAEGTRTEK